MAKRTIKPDPALIDTTLEGLIQKIGNVWISPAWISGEPGDYTVNLTVGRDGDLVIPQVAVESPIINHLSFNGHKMPRKVLMDYIIANKMRWSNGVSTGKSNFLWISKKVFSDLAEMNEKIKTRKPPLTREQAKQDEFEIEWLNKKVKEPTESRRPKGTRVSINNHGLNLHVMISADDMEKIDVSFGDGIIIGWIKGQHAFALKKADANPHYTLSKKTAERPNQTYVDFDIRMIAYFGRTFTSPKKGPFECHTIVKGDALIIFLPDHMQPNNGE